MNNIPVLVTAAQAWDFMDEQTGQKRTGCTVHLVPLNQPQDDRLIGIKPVKYSMAADAYHLFHGKKLPAFALMDSTFNFNNGKMVPINFKSFNSFDLSDYLELT